MINYYILKNKKIFIIIFFLATILRLLFLDSAPPHLRNDEAALGYNAYSILKTAKAFLKRFISVIPQKKRSIQLLFMMPSAAMM